MFGGKWLPLQKFFQSVTNYYNMPITNSAVIKGMRLLFVTATFTIGSNVVAQQPAYLNKNLTAHERAVDLTSRLTLQEKADRMCDESPAIPRLGIKPFS